MTVINIDCFLGMRTLLSDNCIDAIVTDPPYELNFMGNKWDACGIAYSVDLWRECLRVLKPGGHLLAFSGARTYHRMACAIEDAGFQIRDQVMWVFGSGFPKSVNVGEGRGTALKPAHEPICVARKPLEGTIVNNVNKYNTGVININRCRIGAEQVGWTGKGGTGNTWNNNNCGLRNPGDARPVIGRFPANLIHDGSNDVLNIFKQQDKQDTPARFYYCAKASRHDRDEGLQQFAAKSGAALTNRQENSAGLNCPAAGAGRTSGGKNIHPTVKPTELMRYLIKLITPVNGIILDPFAGSGSTGKAAALEQLNFIGFELNSVYTSIANARIAAVKHNY